MQVARVVLAGVVPIKVTRVVRLRWMIEGSPSV